MEKGLIIMIPENRTRFSFWWAHDILFPTFFRETKSTREEVAGTMWKPSPHSHLQPPTKVYTHNCIIYCHLRTKRLRQNWNHLLLLGVEKSANFKIRNTNENTCGSSSHHGVAKATINSTQALDSKTWISSRSSIIE